MAFKDRILQSLQVELEPLGFRYIKSANTFKKQVSKSVTVKLVYDADCYHRGITDVTLLAGACYRDIEDVLYKLTGKTVSEDGHFGFVCRLQWLIPEGESSNIDFSFRDNDDEATFNHKRDLLLRRMRTYAIPYIERLSNRDSAIEEASALDRKELLFTEGVVPVMYCVWNNDKAAALCYLEEKRHKLYERVSPEEWEFYDKYKGGEIVDYKKLLRAFAYEEFMSFADRFKEWVK